MPKTVKYIAVIDIRSGICVTCYIIPLQVFMITSESYSRVWGLKLFLMEEGTQSELNCHSTFINYEL